MFVIAAGNEAIDASTVTPAHVREAITVGAYAKSGRFASFSNYGEVIDLLAPGIDVMSMSAKPGRSAPAAIMSGTSAAAPHVAGAVALLMARSPSLQPGGVVAALMSAAYQRNLSIAGVPENTTSISVWVGGFDLVEMQEPELGSLTFVGMDTEKGLEKDKKK